MNVFERLAFDLELLLTSTELWFYRQKLVSFLENLFWLDVGNWDRFLHKRLLNLLVLFRNGAMIIALFYVFLYFLSIHVA